MYLPEMSSSVIDNEHRSSDNDASELQSLPPAPDNSVYSGIMDERTQTNGQLTALMKHAEQDALIIKDLRAQIEKLQEASNLPSSGMNAIFDSILLVQNLLA